MQPTQLPNRSSLSWWIGPVFSELVIALFPLLTYYSVVSSRLPSRVAVHFDGNGIPNRFADKGSMDALFGFIGLGILAFVIGKIIRLVILVPIYFKRDENNKRIGAKIANYTEFFLIILFTYLCLDFQKTSLTNTFPLEDSAKVIFIGINIFFLLMANICPKISPNKFFGIRTPYAFTSDEAWVCVQRFGSKLLACGSLFNILVTLALPDSYHIIITFNMFALAIQTLIIFIWKPKGKKVTP